MVPELKKRYELEILNCLQIKEKLKTIKLCGTMKKFTKLNTTLRIYGVYEIMITSYAININETYQDKRNNMPMV